MMNKKSAWTFCIVFAIILGSGASIQALQELRSSRTIQSFDLWVDQGPVLWHRLKQSEYQINTIGHQWSVISRLDTSADASNALDSLDQSCGQLYSDLRILNSLSQLDSLDPELSSALALHQIADSLVQNWNGDSRKSWKHLFQSTLNQGLQDYGHSSILNILKFPIWWWKGGILNASYLHAYEKTLEKESILAQAGRSLIQFGKWKIFAELGEKAFKGKGSWLYYRPDIDALVQPDILDPRSNPHDVNGFAIRDSADLTILRFQQQLQKRGIDLLVVIVPTKGSIYPEFFNEVIPNHGISFDRGPHFLQQLQHLGVQTVDLYEPFKNQKMHLASGQYLYLFQDTHWTPMGAEIAAQVIAARVRQIKGASLELDQKKYCQDTISVDRNGDIAEMTGLKHLYWDFLNQDFPTQKVISHPVLLCEKDSLGQMSKTPWKDEYSSAQILILGDSYSRIYQTDEPRNAGWIAHLSQNLGVPLASIVSDGGASTLVRQKLARKAGVLRGKKLVIWEFVERDLRFGEEGWKDVSIP